MRRGYELAALPAEGYDGPTPEWPLPLYADLLPDLAGMDRMDAREADLWSWAWRTPQACAWSLPSEAWRTEIVARWVRQAVVCESPGAKAADHGQLHRYADQIGLTTAGLREMGWKVAPTVDADPGHESIADDPQAVPERRRLRAV